MRPYQRSILLRFGLLDVGGASESCLRTLLPPVEFDELIGSGAASFREGGNQPGLVNRAPLRYFEFVPSKKDCDISCVD